MMIAMFGPRANAVKRKRIAVLGPKSRTTRPAAVHKIFPYLLRDRAIKRPHLVCCADIICIPIGHAFLYLLTFMDRANWTVLAWRLSNTTDVSFGVEAIDQALVHFGHGDLQHRPG
ncbi:hypothetical protein [Bradyrhizobium monzae]|uniref:hypothetical protein n=1 Tax=Bradyrhizobium sp. Oc8 TaxID=2876780 RepID=UPI001F38D53F|nr:hypothetical protein [Bradyrhizobium sp. Oc8]